LLLTILENQLRHHGAINQQAEAKIRIEYDELFCPSETEVA
jgi:hypothetical protein